MEKKENKPEMFETVTRPITRQENGEIFCIFCGKRLGSMNSGYRPCDCENYGEAYSANIHAGYDLLHKRGRASLSHIQHEGD